MKNLRIWSEMARRKIQFHPKEKWDEIRLWGLFKWGEVFSLLKRGELLTCMKKENVTVWVRPTKEMWIKNIEPLIKKHTLDELTTMAGWDIKD